jgi:hyperosmotically inducible protein
MINIRLPFPLALALNGALVFTLSLGACSKPTPVLDTPVSTTSAPAPAVAATETSDAEVTTRVKTALLADDMTKPFEVTVATLKGDVRLTGVMDTQPQIDRALAVTRALEGVHAVHDELTLKR